MIRLAIETSGQKDVFRFDRAVISIGRESDNDLVLPHESVGAHHATVLRLSGTRFAVRSIDPERVVTVNEAQSFDTAPLEDGDVVGIGGYRLSFLEHEPFTGREAEFLRALEERPADDDTRVVYSDWLEEHGRDEEAAFVRLQLSLARPDLRAHEEEFLLQATRLRGLGRRLPAAWRRTVARPPIENCDVRFELQCPKKWASLKPTDSPTKRFCDTCNEHVHYAANLGAARELAMDGKCVAVDITQERQRDDLEPPTLPMVTAGIIAPPSGYGYGR